jgi:hypothetical protein
VRDPFVRIRADVEVRLSKSKEVEYKLLTSQKPNPAPGINLSGDQLLVRNGLIPFLRPARSAISDK